MIFVTVGTQLAFDRLIRVVDDWAGANPEVEIFAQIGPLAAAPRHIPWEEFLPPRKAEALMRSAELIVAHAGMGSILTALRFQKPILVMPRLASLGEHRNEHQLATARLLGGRPGICVAWSEDEVAAWLTRRNALATGPRLSEFASGPLVDRLAAYVASVK